MKNIQYTYIILLSMFISFTSCEIESAEEEGRPTEAGKIVYDETINTIQYYIHTLNLAQKIDLYLQSDSAKRVKLEFWLLEGYSISEVGEDVLVQGKVNWKVNRKSTDSLHLPSSQWTIYQSSSNGKQAFQITAQTQRNWKVLIKNSFIDYDYDNYDNYYGYNKYNYSIISNAHLQIEMLTNKDFVEDVIVNNYSVKMVDNTFGTITSNRDPNSPDYDYDYDNSSDDEYSILISKYSITQPILFKNQEIFSDFVEGEIAMEVSRSDDNVNYTNPEEIVAKILPESKVSIDFRGINEIWNTNNMNLKY